MRCPKSRFPIQIIVFDELELIIFVSQGLTLLTASLVNFYGLGILKTGSPDNDPLETLFKDGLFSLINTNLSMNLG